MKKRIDGNTIKGLLLGVLIGVILIDALLLWTFGGVGGLRAAEKFALVMKIVDRNFVADYDLTSVTDAALTGAISDLDDRWSYYMDADTYEAYLEASANRYQGIGVTITQEESTGGFLIVAVTKDAPAQQAGLVVGDTILAVDGTDVTGGDTQLLHDLIQADFGKDALITIRHTDGQTEDIAVSCEEVYNTPVTAELLDGKVGYIIIDNFREGSGEDAISAVDELMEKGAEALVFDVRSNPGGMVSELVRLLDYLLPEGELFIQSDRNGKESIEYSGESCIEMPMAVLVNESSCSAAEYFAAALREYEWATVVGEATTGKARSQITIAMSDGSAVHLSKYSYLTPKRVDLYETGGIVPDVEIALTEEQRLQFDTGWLEPDQDPQVLAAIEAIFA